MRWYCRLPGMGFNHRANYLPNSCLLICGNHGTVLLYTGSDYAGLKNPLDYNLPLTIFLQPE